MYKLVGHTHSHCDRVFSRIKASLMGKSYISEDDMKQIIVSTLKSYKMEWDRLHASLDFEALKTLLGLDIHHQRNVHDLEIFRTTGGVFVRWKQYISDELDTVFTMPVVWLLCDIMHGGAPRGCRLESSAIVPDDMLLLNCPGPCVPHMELPCLPCLFHKLGMG